MAFWFGKIEKTILPSESLVKIWLGKHQFDDQEISEKFKPDLDTFIHGDYTRWNSSPRGRLAAIILLDQFLRQIYRDTPMAFSQDNKALEICIQGMHQKDDHRLSLIERAFYYFPFVHSEKLVYQEQGIKTYRLLAGLAFEETKLIYDSFLKFANHHYTIIRRFGRFPQRNAILGRISTPQELQYLKEEKEYQDE